jgi:hypothetical protein
MSGETSRDIYWALQAFNRICRYDNLKDPNVILTDDASRRVCSVCFTSTGLLRPRSIPTSKEGLWTH